MAAHPRGGDVDAEPTPGDDPQGSTADDLGEADRRYRLAFDRGLRLLALREHTVRELTDKLTARGVDAATAALVVDDLRGRGLQSDARFAEAFVHSRVSRGQGPVRIRQELARRGVDTGAADEAIAAAAPQWRALAADARRRKFGDAAPEDRAAWQRQARFLTQRGFPSDVVYRVLGDDD